MKNKYDYLIVGAGLFGAAFAQIMTERGKKCLVVEKRKAVGGNIATEQVEGITVHKYGAHIFHTSDRRVWDYVNRFAEFNGFINCPIANYKGKLFNLPFNMHTFYQLWGCKTPAEAHAIIDAQTAAAAAEVDGEPKNLEQKAMMSVGEDVYKTLIKGYTEKQWGRDCKELPAFIIGRVPLRFVFDNNYFNDRYQGIPIGGYSQMISKMLDGVDVQLCTDYFSDRERLSGMAKTTLYTGQIDRFFDYRFGELEYRSLRFETKVSDAEDYQGNAVVNYTDYETPYTRIIEHKHFDRTQKSPKTVITREYPLKFEKGGDPYYPINDKHNSELYQKYKQLADQSGVLFGGRLADYKYYDMDDTIAAVFELTDKLNKNE